MLTTQHPWTISLTTTFLLTLSLGACDGSAGGGAAAATGGALCTTPDCTTGGATGTNGGAAAGGSPGMGDTSRCDAAGLVWKTGHKTNYESYPDPGSPECIEYNGCTWAGQFATCNGTQTEEWVEEHNIVAMFPLGDFGRHDICIRSGDKMMVVTVFDTCGDTDCSGCCTENKGDADALIDLEKYTNQRWGLPDGDLEWADLGENLDPGCPGY